MNKELVEILVSIRQITLQQGLCDHFYKHLRKRICLIQENPCCHCPLMIVKSTKFYPDQIIATSSQLTK